MSSIKQPKKPAKPLPKSQPSKNLLRRNPLTEAILRVLFAAMILTLASCVSLPKHESLPTAPPAGCEERTPGIDPGQPPVSTDYMEWATAWVKAMYAWADVTTKRAITAECLDANRSNKGE